MSRPPHTWGRKQIRVWKCCVLQHLEFWTIDKIQKLSNSEGTQNVTCFIRDSSVGLVTGYGIDGLGSIPSRAILFFSPQRPDRLWGPSSLLSNTCRSPFPQTQSFRYLKLATHCYGRAIPPVPAGTCSREPANQVFAGKNQWALLNTVYGDVCWRTGGTHNRMAHQQRSSDRPQLSFPSRRFLYLTSRRCQRPGHTASNVKMNDVEK
jgi:hypothetical protein